MIEIERKEDCVGCAACVQRCPEQCISFNEDEQGFRYPKVDPELCIQCGLCEKVCPVINQADPQIPANVYAARNNDEVIWENSSSGGIFHALAGQVIDEGGIVFGVRFNDEWEVEHGYSENLEGIKAFQTSKYVQSYIGESFRKAEEFLKAGRRVMFSGTPCQIAALNLYLGKDYGPQLIKVDIVCHGVPSPGIWRGYLDYLLRRLGAKINMDFQSTQNDIIPVVTGINFRDKKLGWGKYGFSVHAVARKGDKNSDPHSTMAHKEGMELFFEPHYENFYMRGFLKDLYLRPSCYECPTRSGRSHADITLADFWGIQKAYPDCYSQGYVSLLLVRTDSGREMLKSSGSVSLKEVSYEMAFRGNPAMEKSPVRPRQYVAFWESYSQTGISALENTLSSMRPAITTRLYNKLRRMMVYILGVKGLNICKE